MSETAESPKVATSRFVTIELAAAITGFSPGAIRTKIARGVWAEGREWLHAPDNRVLIDMRGYERWAAKRCGSGLRRPRAKASGIKPNV